MRRSRRLQTRGWKVVGFTISLHSPALERDSVNTVGTIAASLPDGELNFSHITLRYNVVPLASLGKNALTHYRVVAGCICRRTQRRESFIARARSLLLRVHVCVADQYGKGGLSLFDRGYSDDDAVRRPPAWPLLAN